MNCLQCRKPISVREQAVHGLHLDCFKIIFEIKEFQDFEDLIIRQTSYSSLQSESLSQVSFKGRFKKYNATLAGKGYILKVQDQAFPDLPIMEYLCNQIARLCQLKVPDFNLVFLGNVRPTFVNYNIMNDYPEANLVHLYHFQKPNEPWSCESILDLIDRTIGRLQPKEDFVRICLFDALIGNHDRHGRNLAIIQTAKQVILAPFYDNVSYFGIEEEGLLAADQNPRGNIYTKKSNKPSMKDYVAEFSRLGYCDVIEGFYQDLPLKIILEHVEKSTLVSDRKKAFSQFILKRHEELCHEKP